MIINSALPVVYSSPKGAAVPVLEAVAEGRAKLKEAVVQESRSQLTSKFDSGTRNSDRSSAPLPALTIDLRVLKNESDSFPNRQAINAYRTIETFNEPALLAANQGLDLIV